MEDAAAEAGRTAPRKKLGTLAGVFTPSVLTILGIILFLRLGYVVGAGGLGRALLVIAIANLISVLTSISLATIATSLRVKGGGDYYLISRTLGAEYGGALGIVLFLAQSVSIAFYAIGFGEALAAILGDASPLGPQGIAAAAVAALFLLAWLGADAATRFQFGIMAVLIASLVAFFLGGFRAWNGELLRENWTGGGVPFWAIFAIFFPAVTGFTQGVSMSGDLEDPGKSLPRGTFAAVGVSIVVYFGVAVVFAASMPGSVLASDYSAMRRVSLVTWLVDAGVIAATISSALASFLGAPRILQSLARDRVFPFLKPFAKGAGPSGNPRRGVLLSAALAFATIGLGDLNVIAPVVSMFFLISYGLLNYATYFAARAASPSFRPTFRFYDRRVSLIGAVACLAVMLAIDPVAGAAAVAVLFGIHQYLRRTVDLSRWADSSRSHRLRRVREDLHAVSAVPAHPRDWRPVILAFSDDPQRRERILRFASWIEGKSGFTTAVRILEGSVGRSPARLAAAEAEILADIHKRGLDAFALALGADGLETAVPIVLRAHGVGPVRANTVLLNWFDRTPGPEDAPGLRAYSRYVGMAQRLGCHVIVLEATSADMAAFEATAPGDDRRIDVWHLDDAGGPLMLLLAYLMTRTPDWEGASIRLLAAAEEGRPRAEAQAALERMVEEARIEAEVLVVDAAEAADVARHSAEATLVFLPFHLSAETPVGPFGATLEELLDHLGLTALVLPSQETDLDAEPEEGVHAEIGAARDAGERARRVAEEAEKAAASAQQRGQEAREAAQAAEEGPEREALVARVAEAEQEAEEQRTRAARARTMSEEALREAAALSGKPEEEEREEEG